MKDGGDGIYDVVASQDIEGLRLVILFYVPFRSLYHPIRIF